MGTGETGRKVLLIIDVQEAFLDENTRNVVDFLRNLLREERFDSVIQSCWRNCPGSRYEMELGYREGREARPLLRCPGERVLLRSTYSAANSGRRSSCETPVWRGQSGLEAEMRENYR